ncbi:MAG TPA: hypothetical protein VHN78_14175 [Chloroflexota bacterium]|nr:hypothetical protein [Chloroflexota bacterium]
MSRHSRTWLLAAGVVVAVVVVGQVLLPGSSEPAGVPVGPLTATVPAEAAGAPVARDVGPAAPAPAGATTVVAGVPMGYHHDAGGAKAAAATFAKAYGTLVALDEAGAVAAKRAMASAAAAPELLAAMQSKLGTLRQVWPVGTITYRVAPLAVRVRMEGADAATAEVWYVGVVAGRGIPTYEEWVTQSFKLVWERDDWRIAAESDAPGPRPDPGRQSPATAAELDSRLAGFEAVA